MKAVRIGVAIAAALCMTACATVTRGTKQKFRVTSEPAGADVALSTGQTCVTPCELKLKRKSEFTTKVSKAGYEPVEVSVRGKLKGGGAAGAAGNILVGGIIGGIVDGSNGSLLSLLPNPVAVTLKPVAVAAVAAPVEAAAAAPVADTSVVPASAPATPAPN